MSKFILCNCSHCLYMIDDGLKYYCKKQNKKEIQLMEFKDCVFKINGCLEFVDDPTKGLFSRDKQNIGVMEYD